MKLVFRLQKIMLIAVTLALGATPITASSAVLTPALELEFLPGDANVSLSAGFIRTLSLEGHVTGAVTDLFPGGFDIPDAPFFLNTIITSTTSNGTGGFSHTSGGGTFTIDGGSQLNAILSNVVLTSSSSNQHTLSANLAYISGSLVPTGIANGSINAMFTGPVAALNSAYSSTGLEFLSGQIGPVLVDEPEPSVVPLPATAWLFCTALAGLCAFTRRHNAKTHTRFQPE